MSSYTKPSFGSREQITHRVLHYLHDRTSSRFPEWREVTLTFFYELFRMMEGNPSLNVIVQRADGLHIYSGPKKVAFLHFYQRHFLVMALPEYLIWTKGSQLFRVKHKGSFPRMWKATTQDEVIGFLKYLSKLRRYTPTASETKSRRIPPWVKTFVMDRDGGKCVSCAATDDLHFDHILPFSMGGSSRVTENIQLLCATCNLKKSASLRT